MMKRAFVAGATGYTGQGVVRLLRALDIETIAHIRPGSSQLAAFTQKAEALGAEVDTSPWERAALEARLADLKPDLLFALLGTTRKRAKAEGQTAKAAYQAVDYGLTALLIDICTEVSPDTRLIYLSSLGADRPTSNAYLHARYQVEEKLRGGTLPFTIARPSFITGSDRQENRPGERYGAVVVDGLLSVVGALGGKGIQGKFASLTATQLASGLIHSGLYPAGPQDIFETDELRRRGQKLMAQIP